MLSNKLSICIPVLNKYNFTKLCISELSHLSKDHEIIIIDNGSTDETQLKLKGSNEVIYFRFNENKGFAKACNKGYELSHYDNVLFLNNDIKMDEGKKSQWTKPLIDKCELGLVGPSMHYMDHRLEFIDDNKKSIPKYNFLSGWCLASSKENFDKIQERPGEVFCEDYFVYFEDAHLSFRAKQLNIKLLVENVPVTHFGKITSKQINTIKLYMESRQKFINRWGR